MVSRAVIPPPFSELLLSKLFSNDQFKTGANYPGGGDAYFSTPAYTAYSGTAFGSALPQVPGVERNSLNGPRYRGFRPNANQGIRSAEQQDTRREFQV
jgi:hypothetical protein